METKKRRITKQDRVLEYLQTHVGITSLEAINMFGATRLSAIIFNLKKKGYNIITYNVEVVDRYGDQIRVAEYRLIP